MRQADLLTVAPLLGASHAHVQVLEILDRVAKTDAEVLLSGPTGSGKELYATYLHQRSHRAKAPFVPINCSAFPAELVENELFGHIGGAFTGARSQSSGLIEAAEGGTLFFDEVNSLPIGAQAKVLRFLQQKEYRRLGETRLRHADIRIVAASNSNLVEAVRQKSFREDLFFRLRVVPVAVPSLAERSDDIPVLLEEFATRYAEAYRMPRIVISDRAMRRMRTYAWPGNIRELENCVKYLTCMRLSRPVDPYDLPLLDEESEAEPNGTVRICELVQSGPLRLVKRELVDQLERAYLEDALRRSGGNITEAARNSGKQRRAFFELMRKHGLVKQRNAAE